MGRAEVLVTPACSVLPQAALRTGDFARVERCTWPRWDEEKPGATSAWR